jgi:hypothetical protein
MAAEVHAGLERAVERFGRVDGVANCVGSPLFKPARLTSRDKFDAIVSAASDPPATWPPQSNGSSPRSSPGSRDRSWEWTVGLEACEREAVVEEAA